MAITNLERKIRFSNLTPTEYDTIANEYSHNLLPILMESQEFVTALESKGSHVMSKKQLETEATKLTAHSDPAISSCGRAILQFLASGVQTIDEVLIAITSVVLAGGVILSTCISLILGFLLYAVTILPASVLIVALAKQYESLDKFMGKSNDPNVRKYKTLTKNIMSKKEGVKDIHELSKVVNVSEALQAVIDCDCETPNENVEVHNYCSILKAIDDRIGATDYSDGITSLEMSLFGDLVPSDYAFTDSKVGASILESVDFGSDDGTGLYVTFENIVKQPMLSGEGLLHGVICTVTEAANKNTILKFLNCYKATAKYEFTHENYSDIPLLKASGTVLEYVASRCGGNSEMLESVQQLDQIFASIVDEAYTEVTEEALQGGAPVTCANPSTTDVGFNPDPYNIGSLTPFPVASRKVGSILCDICKAETDDEITEAMLNFARVSTIINECYSVEGDDEGGYIFLESNAGKVARRVSDKAHQKFSASATKDKTGGVKEAIKRTIDPMEKFIQKQYDTMKEKDANERRNVILKGGAMPKVLRWVKRGIGILIGAAVGQVIPAAAIVTGIVFLGYIATDKYLDKKERAKLLRDLEDEIQICNEKIDDSRGDDNKQKKYELMRIRNQLTRTSEKIRLGLKY